MEFKIGCPWCNQHYLVDDSFIGQNIECSVCGKQFTVSKTIVSTPPSLSTLTNTKATEKMRFFRTTVAANSDNKSKINFSNQDSTNNTSSRESTPESIKNSAHSETNSTNKKSFKESIRDLIIKKCTLQETLS